MKLPPHDQRDGSEHASAIDQKLDEYWYRLVHALSRPRSLLALVLLVFIATRVWLLLGLEVHGQDTKLYGRMAREWVDAGRVPYRDFGVEYPPVAWWLMTVPRLINSKTYVESKPTPEMIDAFFQWYYRWFRAEMFLVDLVCFALMFVIGRRMLPTAPSALPAIYTLLTAAQPHLIYDRLDIGLLMFFLLFIECHLRSLDDPAAGNRWPELWGVAGYLFLGLGISFKLMPLFFVPFLLLADVWAAGSLWRFVGRVLALAVGAVGPFLVHIPSAGWGLFKLFQYHSERGTHMESIWSSIMLVAAAFGVPCRVAHSHGGFNLESDWSSTLKIASTVCLLTITASFGLWARTRAGDDSIGSWRSTPRFWSSSTARCWRTSFRRNT